MRKYLAPPFAVAAIMVGITTVGVAHASRAVAASTYYYENTSTSKYALAADEGVKVPLGAKSSATTFVRINFKAYESVGYYEYEDQTTFDCLKIDPNISHTPIVEEPCSSGDQEELFSDPPNPRSLYAVETLGVSNSILQSYGNAMAECSTVFCTDDNWALPAA